MKKTETLNISQLLDKTDYVDNTDYIRNVKNSILIRDNIRKIENLKSSHTELRLNNPELFNELCKTECRFLYDNYTDIFNKILKDEIDLSIMTQLLMVLKLIEDGKIDQESGSVMVGKVLKELYIDSALKRGNNIDKEHINEKIPSIEGSNISWKQFKQTLDEKKK